MSNYESVETIYLQFLDKKQRHLELNDPLACQQYFHIRQILYYLVDCTLNPEIDEKLYDYYLDKLNSSKPMRF